MVDNDYNYIVAQTSQGIDFDALGYNGGAVSTDGTLIVIDKGDQTKASDIGYAHDGVIPAWLLALAPNAPDANHAEAKLVVRAVEFAGVE